MWQYYQGNSLQVLAVTHFSSASREACLKSNGYYLDDWRVPLDFSDLPMFEDYRFLCCFKAKIL